MRSEEDGIKELETENKCLKIALTDTVLVKDVPECLIEKIDSDYETDVKKSHPAVTLYSETPSQPVKAMCKCFDYTYYKLLKKLSKRPL